MATGAHPRSVPLMAIYPVRVVLADSAGGARTYLRALMEEEWGWEVLAEAGDGIEAVREARSRRPDVLVVDERIDGLTLAEIREMLHDPGLLVVGLLTNPEAHAQPYSGLNMLKSVPLERLRETTVAALDELRRRPIAPVDNGEGPR